MEFHHVDGLCHIVPGKLVFTLYGNPIEVTSTNFVRSKLTTYCAWKVLLRQDSMQLSEQSIYFDVFCFLTQRTVREL